MSVSIAITSHDSSQQHRAEELAQRLALPAVTDGADFDFLLTYTEARLELRKTNSKTGGVYADFVSGKVAHRFRYGGGRGQLIAKAVGLKSGNTPSVLDLTAGLGRDGFVLASLGCEVTMVERSPIVAALLRDGLERAATVSEIAEVMGRISLLEQEGANYMQSLSEEERPDICYLDPMYPHSKKSALPGKEMMLFREVVGEDQDTEELLEAAMVAARRRVVVKRPRKALPLGHQEPDFQITGKSTRYDIYLSAQDT
ncbi:MAG: class I SAM-dependent methyltransferase [Gammaproteobacteria bacterium]|uniref:Ribosomal RNA small subunit methyltransferase J n=1 Tax=Candidatus Thiopontia autotrophica TaxID=2841688 RepID=A0A8J6PAW4_9GAMM|nr:class I SAM-dependent methyltransferase [Candidatus Thiopontia autotrophica]